MTKTIKFIDTVIRNLEAPKKRAVFWCEGSPGFGLRLSPSGTKTFVFKYMVQGVSRWVSLGRYPANSIREARAEYNQYYEAVHDYGRDPIAEERAAIEEELARRSVAALIDDYLDLENAKGKASLAEEQRVFDLDVIPTIGDKFVEDVTSQDIDKIQHRILKRAKSQVRATRNGRVAIKQTLAYLRQLFAYAEKRGLVPSNPVNMVDSLGKGAVRNRVLSFQEIWLFWHRLETIGLPVVTVKALKLMLCTMQRGNEIRHMRYGALKLNEGVWEMRPQDTKNKTMHRVPLRPMAQELLSDVWEYTHKSEFVFGATRLMSPPEILKNDLKPLGNTAFPQALRKNRDKLGIEDVRPHDLRRTGATWITAVGLPKTYARLILNHSDGDNDVTGEVYVQYSYDFEKRLALDVWEFIINEIISAPTQGQVPTLEEMRNRVRESELL